MLLTLASVTTTVGAEETIREVRVEATIPQSGNVMVVGFDSLWMMSMTTSKLVRINPDDNRPRKFPSLEQVFHSLVRVWPWEKAPSGCRIPIAR